MAVRMRKVLAGGRCSVFRLAEFWFKLTVRMNSNPLSKTPNVI